MENVNKTLYIPLFGKALVSRRGIILPDKKAEAIWDASGFTLTGKAASKWLAYYMGMRAAVFDRWVNEKLKENAQAVVLHLGCGLDSRCLRAEALNHMWFDVDFPEVINERRRFYEESERYRMISGDVRQDGWLSHIPTDVPGVVVMEGISMYLKPEELQGLMNRLAAHFSEVSLLMDCYTCFAAKVSIIKNPINEVGVNQVWGIDDPAALASETNLEFVSRHSMTPPELIKQLTQSESTVFRMLYGGKLADKLYRLYEFSA